VILTAMLGMTASERGGIVGMDPGREDLLPAGAAVFVEAMDILGATILTVADWGLREGLLLALSEGEI
jgi:exopolyphosphatase/guanosine-5'-triphosphate,3'-diphosphate pyrophosphatase